MLKVLKIYRIERIGDVDSNVKIFFCFKAAKIMAFYGFFSILASITALLFIPLIF